MRPSQITSSLLLLFTATAAWPSFPLSDEIVERGREFLGIKRADSSTSKSSFNLSYSSTEGNTATTSASGSSEKQSGSTTENHSQSGSGHSNNTTTRPTQTTFDPVDGPGGISMITPDPISGPTYVKLRSSATFAWNYTSVSILPNAVDILAVGASNSVTWTLAMNQSVPGPTQAFTWDIDKFQASATQSLITEMYTLVVHDAAKDVSAIPSAGYLGTANQFVFGAYSPAAYTPLDQWVCATCSAAVSAVEKKTVAFIFGMAAVTVLSFTWFSGVAGLW